MKRIDMLVDVDEVLADFQTPAFEAILKVTGRRYTQTDFTVWNIFECLAPEEMKELDTILETAGFCASLLPKPGAIEGINAIREFADVYVVTSPQHNRHWVYERCEWLQDHFQIDRRHVFHAHAKWKVHGDAFLDDRPEHVAEWAAKHPDKLSMLWHIPNTRTLGQGLLRVFTWDEVIDHVRKQAEATR